MRKILTLESDFSIHRYFIQRGEKRKGKNEIFLSYDAKLFMSINIALMLHLDSLLRYIHDKSVIFNVNKCSGAFYDLIQHHVRV